MSALHPDLRRRLEKDVIRARQIAEKGAAAAIDRLGVAQPAPPSYLGEGRYGRGACSWATRADATAHRPPAA